jgi:hypothetical protein
MFQIANKMMLPPLGIESAKADTIADAVVVLGGEPTMPEFVGTNFW